MLCLQSQKLQGKSSITRSGTLQTRAEKACLDVLSRLDADLPVSALHGVAAAAPPLLPPRGPSLQSLLFKYISNDQARSLMPLLVHCTPFHQRLLTLALMLAVEHAVRQIVFHCLHAASLSATWSTIDLMMMSILYKGLIIPLDMPSP